MILNTFPELLTFTLIAPLILRVALGLTVFNLGKLKFTSESEGARWKILFETIGFKPANFFLKLIAWIEVLAGIMLIIGSFTQIVAIVLAIMYFCQAILEYKENALVKRTLPFYILLFAISLSLVFTGAGLFAIDMAGI